MNSLEGKKVFIDNANLSVELKDGRVISTPLKWYPELKNATITQIQNYKFICRSSGIEWPDLDYHLSIEAMLIGVQAHNSQVA